MRHSVASHASTYSTSRPEAIRHARVRPAPVKLVHLGVGDGTAFRDDAGAFPELLGEQDALGRGQVGDRLRSDFIGRA